MRSISAIRRRLVRRVERLRRSASALVTDCQGGAAITVGLVAPLAVGAAGLGVDAGLWYLQRHELQRTVDLAAVAAMHAALRGADAAAVTEAATAAAARNGFVAEGGNSLAVDSGTVADGSRRITVAASLSGRRYFSSVLTGGEVVIAAQATASATDSGGIVCVLGLDEQDPSTVDVRGNARLSGCGAASNSAARESLTVVGSAEIEATSVQAYGDIVVTGNGAIRASDIRPYAPRVADPYGPDGRGLEPPVGGGCSGGQNVKIQTATTLSPGRYCGGITITGAEMTLEPGVYVLDDGDLKISGSTRLVGEGVTLVFTGSTPSQIGGVKVTGTVTGELSAPSASSGSPYAGVVVYQDARARSHQGAQPIVNTLLGDASFEVRGAVYFPNQAVRFSGGSEAHEGCMQIVARWVEFQGDAVVQNTDAGCAAIGVEVMRQTRIRIVS